MPVVTGTFKDVTVITADAGENCVTLAEGTKLNVVTVAGFAAYIVALARSTSAPPKIVAFSLIDHLW